MKHNPVGEHFLKIIKRNSLLSIMLLITIAGAVLTSLVPPQILKRIIDQNFAIYKSDGLLKLALFYFLMIVSIGGFDFLKEIILIQIGQKCSKEIKLAMIEKLDKIKIGFFTNTGSGEVVSRFTNDVDAINSLFTNGIVGMMIDLFKIIGIVVSIWIFSARLGMIALLLLPIITVITRIFQKKMLKAQIQNRILLGKVNHHIGESIKNILMIKSYSKESYMEDKYKHILSKQFQSIEKVNFYDSVFPPIIQIIRVVVIGLVVIVSSKQLNVLGLSLGMIAASIDLISNLFAPIEQLGMEFQSIQQAIAGINRVNEFFLEEEEDEKEPANTAASILGLENELKLEFRDLSFQYDEGTKVLRNINLTINHGEKVTFVGRTGVGKSTLFKLVLGLLKPTDGTITINGVDVYQIPNQEKRKLFGYVGQSFPMITGTVADQIALLDHEITKEQIEQALQYVGMLEDVRALEHGIDTMITGDITFSKGQLQLLSIARAIVTNPPILLLDEVTANLDSVTEKKIMDVLQKKESRYMILSISHRLSSMVTSDTVVILEDGKVKNSGSPDKLLNEDEWFKSRLAIEHLTWG